MEDIKKLSLKNVFDDSISYMIDSWKNMLLFVIVHVFFLIVGFELLDGLRDFKFIFWLLFYYLYWYFFFRFYFNRKPYLFTKKVFATVSPSIKILTLTFAVLTILLVLPLLPPFFDIESEWANNYLSFLKTYMEDSRVVDTLTLCIVLFVSPFIFYRPMMAWIASVIGRSSLLKTAFAKTKGNYWKMVVLGGIFNISLVILELMGKDFGLGNWLFIIVGSPVIIFFNVVLVKTYEYFFLEIEV